MHARALVCVSDCAESVCVYACIALFRTVCIFVTNVGARLLLNAAALLQNIGEEKSYNVFFQTFFNHFSSVRVRLYVSVSVSEYV